MTRIEENTKTKEEKKCKFNLHPCTMKRFVGFSKGLVDQRGIRFLLGSNGLGMGKKRNY